MPSELVKKIKDGVNQWREDGYPCSFDELKEILNFQFIDDTNTTLKYLRKPQFEALETYLYLRVVKNTCNTIDLYKSYFTNSNDLLNALNIQLEQVDLIDILSNGGLDNLFERIKTDNDFAKKYKLDVLRESLLLDYPSYIFSLVMGAGKTILIGAIVYIEFALSLITKNDLFLKNALIFAPGKTIIGSLKEISFIEVDKILPKRFDQILTNNLKITYTQDGQKDIPVIGGSEYNIITTNIEKIRILSRTIKKDIFTKVQSRVNRAEKEDIANARLAKLCSLQNLGVFSDEAHNTYGQRLEKSIKKVRQTINYLVEQTNLKLVVNTTGTPYYKKQMLKDVVFWYGLIEGIQENILKDVRGHIYSYADVSNENFISVVLDDFFTNYSDVETAHGHKAKIAFYFPKIADSQAVKSFIEAHIVKYGLDGNAVFEVNSNSSDAEKDTFINKVNDKNLLYRVFLLVGMGKEGWNCPSLFACCLARDLGNSNNFVLQASTRCLRQVTDNVLPARIYLSQGNTRVLNAQLQQNYGEDLQALKKSKSNLVEKKITLIKYDDKLPQITIQRTVKSYVKKQEIIKNIKLTKPEVHNQMGKVIRYDFSKIKYGTLTEKQISDIQNQSRQYISIIEVAQQLASVYSIEYFETYQQLHTIFTESQLTTDDFTAIKQQVEQQIDNYITEKREVEENLTIIKKQGFNEETNEEGQKIYTTTILVNKEKLEQLLRYKDKYTNNGDYSFHYNPYKFDSKLEVTLFEFVLEEIDEKKENIKDFLFIGGITDKSKTDLVFEYRDTNNILRNYTPDFLVIKTNGEFIFVETKGKHLLEDFKIKEHYFKSYLTDKIKYKLMASEDSNLLDDDKKFILKE